jgi:hypothetical protein
MTEPLLPFGGSGRRADDSRAEDLSAVARSAGLRSDERAALTTATPSTTQRERPSGAGSLGGFSVRDLTAVAIAHDAEILGARAARSRRPAFDAEAASQ